eukprot:UN26988
MNLLFLGKKLPDSAKCEKENIQPGNTIYIMVRSTSYSYFLCHYKQKKARLALYSTSNLAKFVKDISLRLNLDLRKMDKWPSLTFKSNKLKKKRKKFNFEDDGDNEDEEDSGTFDDDFDSVMARLDKQKTKEG